MKDKTLYMIGNAHLDPTIVMLAPYLAFTRCSCPIIATAYTD